MQHWPVAMHIPHERLTRFHDAPQYLTVVISACLATRMQKALVSISHVAISANLSSSHADDKWAKQASHLAGAVSPESFSRFASPLQISSKLCAKTATFSFM